MTTGSILALFTALIACQVCLAQGARPNHGTGLIWSTPADCARYPHAVVSRGPALPERVVLARYLPAVADQGSTGSCVGWAAAYYCYSYSVACDRKATANEVAETRWQFSPSFLWHQFNGGDPYGGMRIDQAFDTLHAQGCATLREMPWNANDPRTQPNKAARERAARYRSRRTVNVVAEGAPCDPAVLKTWLAEIGEPIVLGITIYQDFYQAPSTPGYVYSPEASRAGPDGKRQSDRPLGPHAITLIGYDDSLHAFRVVNSWGLRWGDHGFLWLSEAYVRRCVHEAWAEMPGGPVARDPSGEIHPAGAPNIAIVLPGALNGGTR